MNSTFSTPLFDVAARFSRHTVLVVGDVIADEYLTGDCSRLSPEAPVPVLHVTERKLVLGGAANAAANVASLGGRAILIGVVGHDATGRDVEAATERANVRFVPVRDERPTIRKTRVIGQQQQLLRLDYEVTSPINAAVEDAMIAAFLRELPNADVVVISDYAKGVVTESICREIIDASHEAGRCVVVDPRPQHGLYYRECDYITPNWKESLGLLGHLETAPTESAILEHARQLSELMNSNVLLTLGQHGMALYDKTSRECFSVPTVAKEVFDVSGAGDTVVAAFALALACGFDRRDAVKLANRAAGIVVAKLGTATASIDELLAEETVGRLVSRRMLAPLSRALKSQGKRLVTLNGSFDVLHAGHLHILNEARRQGDVLLVGLNSDASVRALKGPERPLVAEQQRAEMLLALRCVDYVHIFDETQPMPFLNEVHPDVHVNGSEYGSECIEAATVRTGGGRIHIIDRLSGLSTSELVQAMDALGRCEP